jgi:hypothetical protein
MPIRRYLPTGPTAGVAVLALGAAIVIALVFVARSSGVLAASRGAASASAVSAAAPTSAAPLCIECIRIRVGLPQVARGPSPNVPDTKFTAIQLPSGQFRGFLSNQTSYAVDGATPWDMGGTAVPVLRPGAAGTYDSCGQWMNHVERSGNIMLGWVHDETACQYQNGGQTHKSMSLVTSTDDGLTWQAKGQIITGMDPPTTGKQSGEGDCTALNGQDGYYYAYCVHARDQGTIVARAPVDDPGPGQWMKYFKGAWSAPGLGGDATKLGGVSTAVARWTTTGQTVGVGWMAGGLGLFFASDRTTFSALREPLLAIHPGSWNRPDPSEVLAYFTLLDAGNGGNQIGDKWMLAYTYVQPNESFSQRYVVFRPIDVSISPTPISPQVGVLLARWYNKALHDHWSTTAAVPGNNAAYVLEAQSGYLMTAADRTKRSVELEECVSQWPGHPDHFLGLKGECVGHGYQRLRTAGWVYAQQQPETQPLYKCYSDTERSHFASNRSDCDGLGKMEALLGYDLVN